MVARMATIVSYHILGEEVPIVSRDCASALPVGLYNGTKNKPT
jgi:hypothetical protein